MRAFRLKTGRRIGKELFAAVDPELIPAASRRVDRDAGEVAAGFRGQRDTAWRHT
jgi:hypothetical protein